MGAWDSWGPVMGLVLAACVAWSGEPVYAQKEAKPLVSGILFNEDDSARFLYAEPGEMKPEDLDKLVDYLAGTQVSVMLINCNAQKTNYASEVWQTQYDGFDPTKGNDQPYFGTNGELDRDTFRKWAHNTLRMVELGVDTNERMIKRCRRNGISPWISIRMNDMHDAPWPESPIHSDFWRDHPEYWIDPEIRDHWADRGLNFALEPVRDYTMALVKEVCERYDMDGLELDWNRFPRHFKQGEEIEQGKVLTEWMGEVRAVVRKAEAQWGHRILLAPRVPSQPGIARGNGLDAVTWAKRGFIDHLIVGPFWHSTDMDVPVEEWTALLDGTGVGVTVSIESSVAGYASDPRRHGITDELRRGVAMSALARGSQGIYVFNHMGKPGPWAHEIGSPDTLQGKDRTYMVAYCDIKVAGGAHNAVLPKTINVPTQGQPQSAAFRLHIGPKPEPGAKGQLRLTFNRAEDDFTPKLDVSLNGTPVAENATFTSEVLTVDFDPALLVDGYNTLQLTSILPATIAGVELTLRFP